MQQLNTTLTINIVWVAIITQYVILMMDTVNKNSISCVEGS